MVSGVLKAVYHLMRGQSHRPGQCATQRVASRSHQDRRPEKVRVERDQTKHSRLRAQRQQRG